MYCPNCGEGLPDGAAFCPHCGGKIPGPGATSTGYSPSGQSDTCVDDVCGPTAVPREPRVEWVAVVLSLFITGLGTMYAGDVKRGAILLVLQIVFSVATLILPFLFFIPVILWIAGMVDGYMSVQRYNAGSLREGSGFPVRRVSPAEGLSS